MWYQRMTGGVDSAENPFVTALQAACDELSLRLQTVESLKEQLEEAEDQTTKVRTLIEELFEHVPEAFWPHELLFELGYNQPIQLKLNIGKPAYSEMLKIVFGTTWKVWTAQAVHDELCHRGCNVPRKFVSNTLSRLVARGALRKSRRGEYKVEGDRRIEFGENTVIIRPRTDEVHH